MTTYRLPGMVAAILFCLCTATTTQATAKPKHQAHKQNSRAQPPTPEATSPNQIESPPLRPDTQPKAAKNDGQIFTLATPKKTVWDWIAYGAGILLAGVGLGGVWIANRTLVMIRRQSLEISRQRIAAQQTIVRMERQSFIMQEQTDHLKDSVKVASITADFARESFLAMKSKERALLTLEIIGLEFSPIPLVNYRITCHGTTPAYILDSWENVAMVPIHDFEWVLDSLGSKIRDVPAVISSGSSDKYLFIMSTGSLLTPREHAEEEIKLGDAYIHFRSLLKKVSLFV